MKMIELTEVRKRDDSSGLFPCVVNLEDVMAITKSAEGDNTILTFREGPILTVEESIKTIMARTRSNE